MKENGRTAKRYSEEFKKAVILDMRNNQLSLKETVRKYWHVEKGKEQNYTKTVRNWALKYATETEQNHMSTLNNIEKAAKNAEKQTEESCDIEILKVENRKLRIENEYLKKLNALVRAEERITDKKHR